METAISIVVALVVAFIAYKVLMGLMRVAVIVLVFGVLLMLWQQGVIA